MLGDGKQVLPLTRGRYVADYDPFLSLTQTAEMTEPTYSTPSSPLFTLTPYASEPTSGAGRKISKGGLAGIVVGVVLFSLLISLGVQVYLRRQQRRKRGSEEQLQVKHNL